MREIKMGMDIKTFAQYMAEIGNVYGDKFVVSERFSQDINDKVILTWYKFFGKYDPDVFESIMNDWITNNSKAPTIANLKSECTKAQVHKYREMEKEDKVPVNTYIVSADWYGK